MKKQSGFTLIELMIVVAIIGILAAIALPAYKDYMASSEVKSAVAEARGGRASADKFIFENSAVLPITDPTIVGLNAETKYCTFTVNVVSPVSGANSTLTCTLKSSNPDLNGGTVVQTRFATDALATAATSGNTDALAGSWACTFTAGTNAADPALTVSKYQGKCDGNID